ncbi:hypothetical protein EYM_03685 [Ignicoccus islandicus DSM 13165]|uniref:Lon proteolytic domain-containing protein n=1 Tax=Ignicoccus islandicus DSM 13165 TaxID=940295 RepID=A0A0U3FQ56_9CREN|nr:S16 family serine protease [Ignicoccus islandicus]ALU12431.1 hypothetical protein EYM_03685 [Ignicoccus islandicus DSM 13165]
MRNRMNFLYTYTLLSLVVLTSIVIATNFTNEVKGCWGYAPAVVGENEGALSILSVDVREGSGRVFIGGPLLGSDFQGSMSGASVAASIISGQPLILHDFSYYLSDIGYNVTINAAGPSGSALAATLALLKLEGFNCTKHVAMTGMVGLAGEVLPVGGVKIKASAVRSYGLVHFLVPVGESVEVKGLIVDEVPSIIDAAKHFGYYLERKSCEVPQRLEASKLVFKSHYEELLKNLNMVIEKIKVKDNELNSTLDQYLRDAKLSANNGNYYAAASYVFTALIKAYARYYKEILTSMSNSSFPQIVASHIHGMNLTNINDRIRDFVNSTLSELEHYTTIEPSNCYSNLWSLEACAAVYSREYRLKNYLINIKDQLHSNVTLDALSNLLALARARAISIELWVNAVNDMSSNKDAPKVNDVVFLAREALQVAYESAKYALGLIPIRGSMASDIGDMVDEAYKAMYNRNYAKVIGMSSLIYETSASTLHGFTNATIVSTTILPELMQRDFCNPTPSFIAYNYYTYVNHLLRTDPESAEALSYSPIFFIHLSEVNSVG